MVLGQQYPPGSGQYPWAIPPGVTLTIILTPTQILTLTLSGGNVEFKDNFLHKNMSKHVSHKFII